MSPSLCLTASLGMALPYRGQDAGFNKGRGDGRCLGHLFVREKLPVVCENLMHSIGKHPRGTCRGSPVPSHQSSADGALVEVEDVFLVEVLHKAQRKD